jgi:hypothetical protein
MHNTILSDVQRRHKRLFNEQRLRHVHLKRRDDISHKGIKW